MVAVEIRGFEAVNLGHPDPASLPVRHVTGAVLVVRGGRAVGTAEFSGGRCFHARRRLGQARQDGDDPDVRHWHALPLRQFGALHDGAVVTMLAVDDDAGFEIPVVGAAPAPFDVLRLPEVR